MWTTSPSKPLFQSCWARSLSGRGDCHLWRGRGPLGEMLKEGGALSRGRGAQQGAEAASRLGRSPLRLEEREARDVPTEQGLGGVRASLALQKVWEEARSRTTCPAQNRNPTSATLILAPQLQAEAGAGAERGSPGSQPAPWPGLQSDREGGGGGGILKILGCKASF